MLLYWKPGWISRLEVQLMGNVKDCQNVGKSESFTQFDSTPWAEMGKQENGSNREPNTNPLQTPPDAFGKDSKG